MTSQLWSDCWKCTVRASVTLIQRTSGIPGTGACANSASQSGGNPLRGFYAFDPRRMVILLIGGDKTGDDDFYRRYVPIADELYDRHLTELRREGLIP